MRRAIVTVTVVHKMSWYAFHSNIIVVVTALRELYSSNPLYNSIVGMQYDASRAMTMSSTSGQTAHLDLKFSNIFIGYSK